MIKAHRVVVRVTREMKLQLEELAKIDRRSLSDWVRIQFEDLIVKSKKKLK